MKKVVFLSFILILSIFSKAPLHAQTKPKTEISSVKLKGETVRFTLTSSKPFIFASNKYVLHIGGKDFSRAEQAKKNGKGVLTFLIGEDDFDQLANGNSMYLTYGNVNDGANMEAMAKQNKCWALGKFNKNLLTK